MNVEYLTVADEARWRALLDRLPQRDTYYLPEFHRLGELAGEGEARCLVVSEGDALLVHPFLVRPIREVGGVPVAEAWADVETVNGYTGPLATTDEDGFLARAWAAHHDWCLARGVVAEFVRFNPLLDNARFARGYSLLDNRDVVVLAVPRDREALWESYPSVQRNMVRKAERDGLVARQLEPAAGLPVFRRLYEETMARVEAAERFRFGDAYYAHLVAALGDRVRLFAVDRGGEAVAAALFLVSAPWMHYHLAGSSERGRRSAANNLLLHAAAEWAVDHGVERLHLGGGRTPRPDDELLRFKASVSRLRAPYRLGRRVHDERAFERLTSLWTARARPASLPDYFFVYRLPVE